MKLSRTSLALVGLLLAAPVLTRADNMPASDAPPPNLLEANNPGFENGLDGWTMNPPNSTMFVVNEQAASLGQKGLQAGTPGDTPNDKADLFSAHVPVQAGQLCRLNFWASFDGRSLMCDAKLEFYGADGQPIAPNRTPGFWWADSVKQQDGCYPYYLRAIVPQGAVTAGVHLTVRPGTKGVAYLDDFSITQEPLPTTASNLPPHIPVEPLLADLKVNPYNGKPAPMIVIKIDDLGRNNYHQWQKVVDFAQIKNVKVNIGIICQTLGGDTPADQAYFDWIKNLQASGLGEFWFHGYDHQNHVTNGLVYTEMDGRTYDEIKQRFDQSQQLAKEKLGFAFHTFGPPGGGSLQFADPAADAKSPHSTADLMRVVQDDPDMKVWLYPTPIDAAARQLEAQGKITVLDRIGSMNIEYPTFLPRYDQLVGGYVHNRGRPYFVLQGHPWHWKDYDFNEFVKIIEFLQSQNVEFTTPSAVAEAISGRSPGAAPAPVKNSQN
jgi:peptidoglycan/xylan/chitin deacetylase (PgdA/CDA1 family)